MVYLLSNTRSQIEGLDPIAETNEVAHTT
jgi:hypothetical protein